MAKIDLPATVVQSYDNNYDIVADQNGTLYYRLAELPNRLYNTGESVSPDELADYPFENMTIENILDLCDLPLAIDRDFP